MTSPLIADRSCGSCSLCCKVQGIQALRKPPGQWCHNCMPGGGCAIYSDRPSECATFYCAWRMWPALGEHWFPAQSHLVVIVSPAQRRVMIKVDPDAPDAWRDEKIYSDIKTMARQMMPDGFKIAVEIADNFVFILPDRDVDIGRIADNEDVVVTRKLTDNGPTFEVHKVRR